MLIKRYAGIDIGSNAARLIIKDLRPSENDKYSLKKRVYIRLPLRMGYDVFTTGEVKEEKIKELCEQIDNLTTKGFIGSWFDKQTKETYVDISLNIKDLNEALNLGKIFNQKAIFDLNNLTEIRL